jgi:hypothetical protein
VEDPRAGRRSVFRQIANCQSNTLRYCALHPLRCVVGEAVRIVPSKGGATVPAGKYWNCIECIEPASAVYDTFDTGVL